MCARLLKKIRADSQEGRTGICVCVRMHNPVHAYIDSCTHNAQPKMYTRISTQSRAPVKQVIYLSQASLLNWVPKNENLPLITVFSSTS